MNKYLSILWVFFSINVFASPSADIEVKTLEINEFLISVDMQNASDVYGLQAEFEFLDENITVLNKQFEHSAEWPKNKMVLHNVINGGNAKYAVSLVRPEKSIRLSGSVLAFKVALKDKKPTYFNVKALKISNQKGVVFRFPVSGKQVLIGESANYLVYYVSGLSLLLIVLFAWLFRARYKNSRKDFAVDV